MTISPVNVPTLIKDLQRIVVELRESDQVNLSLTYAHRVADIIQRRGGDTPSRHVPGQDTETEHKENRNRQLRDLDNENRQLRQLYEDSQWTLHLVMEAHRKELESHFGQHESTPLPGNQDDDDVESLKNRFHKSVALMARDVNEVFRHEQRINEAFSKRIEDLSLENEVLRCVLESQSEESADAVIERLERRRRVSL
ncbi:unnamed protein product [Cylicostephanus goldi]|uniref:Uncharacterized protein n=1 Tax=Cylicostephanus goldi TaxID=71465 RepID=A0A3P6Q3N1_CYLGO|nr:unnamed protein product [Cylicostephanus goldi]